MVKKVRSSPWWLFWLGVGLVAVGAEIFASAFFLRFPVVVPAGLSCPFLSIILNGLIYVALYVAVGLIIGAVVQGLRRVLRSGSVPHLMVTIILLVSAAVYLARGVTLAAGKGVEPSLVLAEHFQLPSTW